MTSGRRVRTDPAPGSDPAPAGAEQAAEDDPRAWGDAPAASRDEELRRDRPPHWG